LGLVHSLYRPRPDSFKDFIAIRHKTYGFQALQTCVHCTSCPLHELVMRVQIQTRDMFQLSQYGIAAAWRFPELTQRGNGKVAEQAVEGWLSQVRELFTLAENPVEFYNFVQNALFLSEVYAFTPQGEVKEFPIGASLVDFAYAIHTDLGNHCVGGKIDGVEVPLRSKIPSGATIEILSDSNALPQLSWLDHVVTPRARSALRAWQRQRTAEEFYSLGARLLNQALKPSHLTVDTLDAERLNVLLRALSFDSLYSLLCAIGKKEHSPSLIAKRLTDQMDVVSDPMRADLLCVQGAQGLVTHFAECCYPVPQEPIEAYLDATQGLMVHRQGCAVLHHAVLNDEIMDVAWTEQPDQSMYLIGVTTYAHNVVGVLQKITAKLAQHHVNIEDIHTSGDAYIKATKLILWVRNWDHAQVVIRQLETIQDIIKVERISEGSYP